MEHLPDDRRCTSHRFISEINRIHGLKRTEAVVIYDLQDLRILHIIDRLTDLIVVHQDQRSLAYTQQVPAGDRADVDSVLVQDREVPVAFLQHRFLDHIRIVIHFKCHQPV